jgi:selenium metabolism protein YedF
VKRLDLRGKTCPVPVIETKRALDAQDHLAIEILVDNDTACENVSRFLESKGFSASVSKEAGGGVFCVTGIKGAGTPDKNPAPAGKILVVVSSDTLGRGSEELGRVLMKSFLTTLKDLEEKPWRIIFLNSGVRLAARESECIGQLRELEKGGVEILSCGTCLDYFHLKEDIGAGRVTNMFEVVSSILQATHVINQ